MRVELGPRDAHKSQACLAISTTPGEVAKKVAYQVGSACCPELPLTKHSIIPLWCLYLALGEADVTEEGSHHNTVHYVAS